VEVVPAATEKEEEEEEEEEGEAAELVVVPDCLRCLHLTSGCQTNPAEGKTASAVVQTVPAAVPVYTGAVVPVHTAETAGKTASTTLRPLWSPPPA
jgi:hypothetical protein